MQEWIEQQILDTYDSMIECIKRNELDKAQQLQQVIDELKIQRGRLLEK